jgi:hypothetical protein
MFSFSFTCWYCSHCKAIWSSPSRFCRSAFGNTDSKSACLYLFGPIITMHRLSSVYLLYNARFSLVTSTVKRRFSFVLDRELLLIGWGPVGSVAQGPLVNSVQPAPKDPVTVCLLLTYYVYWCRASSVLLTPSLTDRTKVAGHLAIDYPDIANAHWPTDGLLYVLHFLAWPRQPRRWI